MSFSSARSSLFLLILGLLLAAVLCLGLDSREHSGSDAQRLFQRAVGGLGLGATTAPYWDYSAFDPRLQPVCTCLSWPVPGIYPYTPGHTASLFHYEERLDDLPILTVREADVP